MTINYPTVTVILCTHKYVEYAEQQVISIKNQIKVNIKLVISIDSTEIKTVKMWLNLIEKYFTKDDFYILKGPQKGFSANFINAIIEYEKYSEYIAFSDHDDIWDDNKIFEAVKCIRNFEDDKLPVLYGSRTKYINENNKFITFSEIMQKPLTLKNALVQCFAGGNTMVFNKNLCSIIKKIGFVNVKSHDWWLYIIISAVNGKIIFDKNSYTSYRQHKNNISGGNKGIYNALARIKALLSGDYRAWNKKNLYYLIENKKIIDEENIRIINDFIKVQDGNFFQRFFYFFKSGIYRQSILGNIAIFIFSLLKKI